MDPVMAVPTPGEIIKGEKKSNWTGRELINWPSTEFLDVGKEEKYIFPHALTVILMTEANSGHFIYSLTARYGLRYGSSNSREKNKGL
ncbi:hypothetical protein CEXT_189391 [Caerostris extrusa]|uniref:Uncharacterized protein n=1 Tax=Caerostris extrusa TaxID=172846 RepID=A0AAV4SFX1_CAEEX|nr:hypothetical protein CEXT_189391 [Caerostris extrusa]